METEDMTALVTDITGIGADVSTIALAVLGVVVIFITFRWAKRAIGF